MQTFVLLFSKIFRTYFFNKDMNKILILQVFYNLFLKFFQSLKELILSHKVRKNFLNKQEKFYLFLNQLLNRFVIL